jgi:hypothetical protein
MTTAHETCPVSLPVSLWQWIDEHLVVLDQPTLTPNDIIIFALEDFIADVDRRYQAFRNSHQPHPPGTALRCVVCSCLLDKHTAGTDAAHLCRWCEADEFDALHAPDEDEVA